MFPNCVQYITVQVEVIAKDLFSYVQKSLQLPRPILLDLLMFVIYSVTT